MRVEGEVMKACTSSRYFMTVAYVSTQGEIPVIPIFVIFLLVESKV